jgi:hypothetical protein
MRITCLVAALALGLIGSPACAADDTGLTTNALLKAFDTGSLSDKNAVLVALHATEDGIGWANVAIRQKGEAPLYCEPSNLAITAEQALDMLRRGATDDRKLGEVSYGMAMLVVLERVFPCSSRP